MGMQGTTAVRLVLAGVQGLITNAMCVCVCHCRTPVRSPTPPRAPEPQQPVPSVQQPAVPAAGWQNDALCVYVQQ